MLPSGIKEAAVTVQTYLNCNQLMDILLELIAVWPCKMSGENGKIRKECKSEKGRKK